VRGCVSVHSVRRATGGERRTQLCAAPDYPSGVATSQRYAPAVVQWRQNERASLATGTREIDADHEYGDDDGNNGEEEEHTQHFATHASPIALAPVLLYCVVCIVGARANIAHLLCCITCCTIQAKIPRNRTTGHDS